MPYEANGWPKQGVVIPAEPGRFELYRLAYEVRMEDGEHVVAVESYYDGPVIAWRIAQPGGEDSDFNTHPLTFGGTNRVEYFKPVHDDGGDIRWCYFWHDAKTKLCSASFGPLPKSRWAEHIQMMIEALFDRPEQKEARKGLPWLICNPPDGSFDVMLPEVRLEATTAQKAG